MGRAALVESLRSRATEDVASLWSDVRAQAEAYRLELAHALEQQHLRETEAAAALDASCGTMQSSKAGIALAKFVRRRHSSSQVDSTGLQSRSCRICATRAVWSFSRLWSASCRSETGNVSA